MSDDNMLMSKLLFAKIISSVYSITFLVFIISSRIHKYVVLAKKNLEPSKKDEESRRISFRDIFQIIIVIASFVFMLFLFLRINVTTIRNAIMWFFLPMYAILFILSCISFVKFLFQRTIDFRLEDIHETSIEFISIVTFFILPYLKKACLNGSIDFLLAKINQEARDLLLVLMFTFWYFISSFLILTFILLSLFKINAIVMKLKKKYASRKDMATKKEKDEESFYFSKYIIKKIDFYKDKRKFAVLFMYIIWIPIIFLDVIIEVLKLFAKQIKMYLDFLRFVIDYIRVKVSRLSMVLIPNQGRNLVLISRVSIVFSFLVTYYLDSYYGILSKAGSRIFEFFCSVMIIPILISQIVKINSKKNALVEQKNLNEVN